ncbi:MAG: hypothetical protein OXH52_09015, partial [Gammaproteobacteria bacterium]|nr:hypothetical protein [Gammaproteobacteria bacterium]
ITLILVPTSYMILDDIGRTLRGILGRRGLAEAEVPGGPVTEGAPRASQRRRPAAARGLASAHRVGSVSSTLRSYPSLCAGLQRAAAASLEGNAPT